MAEATDPKASTPPVAPVPPVSRSEDTGRGGPKLAAEIEIELGDDRNRIFTFGPTQAKLRGHWKRVNLNGDELVEELAKLPDIPGMRIRINYARRLALIYDPLALPEYADVCKKLQVLLKKHFNIEAGPEVTTTREKMDADDLKSWLHIMRRLVDDRAASIIKGDLPDLDGIAKLPGRTRMEWFSNSARACKWQEEFNAYLDRILTGNKVPE